MNKTISAKDSISAQIAAMKRELSADTLKDLKKASKKYNVQPDSLIWCLTTVYSSGHARSNAHSDVPLHVINDGLVEERLGTILNYTPWSFTQKWMDIINPSKE